MDMSRQKFDRRFILLCIWMLATFLASGTSKPNMLTIREQSRNNTYIAELKLGSIVKQELKDGKSHSYRVALIKEQYLHVVVEQQGIDVAVDLSGPGGKDIGKVDDTIDTQGKEEAYIVAEEPGEYLLNVIAVNKTARTRSGMYEIKIEEM